MKINIEIDDEHVEEAIKKLELLDKLWVDIIAIKGMDWQIVALTFGAALGLQGVSSWTK